MRAKTYRIETERLVIRCYEPRDAELIKRSVDESLAHLRPWMPWAKNEPEPVDQKRERLRTFRGQFDLGLDYTFGIFCKDERSLIGSTGLHTRVDDQAREIGYWIHAQHLRQGYATEAVQALIKVGFEIEELDRIEIRCAPDNIASQGIPRKLGFLHEGTLKNRTIDGRGNLRDVMIWTLFQADYRKADFVHFACKAFDASHRRIV
jgi:RimJ/RimL family protein N-acetyltransferase